MESRDKRSVLYRFFDGRDVLLYVGITDRPGSRWSEHMRQKPWWPDVRRQTAEWYGNRDAAEKAERSAIKDERPIYNVVHASGPFRIDSINIPAPLSPEETRLLVYDLHAVMGGERRRLSELPVLLRAAAPEIPLYRKMTGRQLRAALRNAGIRVTNTGNVLRLDPADLRVARQLAG